MRVWYSTLFLMTAVVGVFFGFNAVVVIWVVIFAGAIIVGRGLRQDRLHAAKMEDETFTRILSEHQDLIHKFLKIAERRVARLDDYGDEAKHELPREIRRCLVKIGERENVSKATLRQWWKTNKELHD